MFVTQQWESWGISLTMMGIEPRGFGLSEP